MPFDENGLWQEGEYRSPGNAFTSALQIGNAFKSYDNSQQAEGDRLYNRYLKQASNPEAAEGFQGTSQGQDTLSQWHMDPDTGSAAVSSSPWGRERTAFASYDPEDDDNGAKAADLMRASGDMKGYTEALKGVRANDRASAADDRAETAAYSKQKNEATKEYSQAFLKAMNGGSTPDEASKLAAMSATGYALLKPEDQTSIDEYVKKHVMGGDGKMMPGAKALIDQRNATAAERTAQGGLATERTEQIKQLLPYQKKNLDATIALKGASAALKNVESGDYDDKDVATLVQAASKAKLSLDNNPKGPQAEELKSAMDVINERIKGVVSRSGAATPAAAPASNQGPQPPPGQHAPTKTTLAPLPGTTDPMTQKYTSPLDVKKAFDAGKFGDPKTPEAKKKALKVIKDQFNLEEHSPLPAVK